MRSGCKNWQMLGQEGLVNCLFGSSCIAGCILKLSSSLVMTLPSYLPPFFEYAGKFMSLSSMERPRWGWACLERTRGPSCMGSPHNTSLPACSNGGRSACKAVGLRSRDSKGEGEGALGAYRAEDSGGRSNTVWLCGVASFVDDDVLEAATGNSNVVKASSYVACADLRFDRESEEAEAHVLLGVASTAVRMERQVAESVG